MKGRPKGVKNSRPQHKWSEDEKQYLKDICTGKSYKEISKLMFEKFNYDFTEGQIGGALKRYNLTTGLTGYFPKGNKPWNKGNKGQYFKGCEKTWFKKGHAPVNYRPVGSERINVDGYTEIKIKDPNKWTLKHKFVWEKVNGPVPKGFAVIFADGNKANFEIDNLLLVSRKQLLVLNNNKLIQKDSDLTKTGLKIADLIIKINEKKKGD